MLAARIRRTIGAESRKREEVERIRKLVVERVVQTEILKFNRVISLWESIWFESRLA